MFINFLFFENRAVCLIMSEECYGAIEVADGNMAARCMLDMHPPPLPSTPTDEHVILFAFPLLQWFRECPSVLRCTYIGCPVDTAYHHSYVYINFSSYLSEDTIRVHYDDQTAKNCAFKCRTYNYNFFQWLGSYTTGCKYFCIKHYTVRCFNRWLEHRSCRRMSRRTQVFQPLELPCSP
jgi:hypothetical protein